jgi:transcription elongation GreA/GreB family factor
VGRAIAGHEAGETVRVETPEGERDVTIVDVRTPG